MVAAALVARLVLLAQLAGDPLLRPTGVLDDAVYFRLAQRAAGGDWVLGPGAYHVAPLYVYFLAVVFRVSGAVAWHAQLVQAFLGAAAVAIVGVTAARLYGRWAGVLAAALAGLTGVLAFHEVLVLQSALDPFLAALALERLSAALAAPTVLRFATAGAAFGLLGLNRPNALVALVLVAGAVFLARRSRPGAVHVLALAAGAALALAPVAIRNRAVTGEWLLVASHGGLNFYIGNNGEADGTYHPPPGVTPTIEGQSTDTRRLAEAAAGRALNDTDVSDHYYALGWRWIRGHPGDAGRLFLRKLALAFHATELPLNYAYAYWSSDVPTLLRALVVGPWILVPLGLAGALLPAQAGRRVLLPWAAFIPAYAVAVAAFFVASRYRLPLVVALCVAGGGALDWTWRVARRGPASAWRAPVAAAAIGLVAAHWPWGLDDGLANERTERLVHLVAEGRHDEARRLLERTEPIHPDPGFLHYRVGRAWLDAGRAEAAAAHLRRSLQAAPGQGEVHLALGQALLRLGRADEALPHLRRARAEGTFPDVAGLELARALSSRGDVAAARAAVAETPLLADTDATTAVALGVLAVTLERPESALRFLKRALELDSGAAGAREHLALALEQLGRRQEAIDWLEAACRLSPSDPSAHFNLALLYAREGRLADARRHARRSLDLDATRPHARTLLEQLEQP